MVFLFKKHRSPGVLSPTSLAEFGFTSAVGATLDVIALSPLYARKEVSRSF